MNSNIQIRSVSKLPSAFGSVINELSYRYASEGDTAGYRYGVSGKEQEVETSKNVYDFGDRAYNCLIGRWFSPDPMYMYFSDISPYNYCINSPIGIVDKDGDFPIPKDAVIINSNWHGGCLMKMANGSYLFVRMESPHGTSDWTEEQQVWYKFSYFSNKWEVINAPVSCTSCDLALIATWATKNLIGLSTPIEELYILYSGKNFNGEIDSRKEAGIWLAIGIVPGGKILKPVVKILKPGVEIFIKSSARTLKTITISFKISDEIKSLVNSVSRIVKPNAKEIIITTISGSGDDALKVAKNLTNLGDDAKPFYGEFGRWEGKLTGWQSADGKSGWRVDWDEDKGAHINWWNDDTGEKGAILIDSNEKNIENIINNEIVKSWQ